MPVGNFRKKSSRAHTRPKVTRRVIRTGRGCASVRKVHYDEANDAKGVRAKMGQSGARRIFHQSGDCTQGANQNKAVNISHQLLIYIWVETKLAQSEKGDNNEGVLAEKITENFKSVVVVKFVRVMQKFPRITTRRQFFFHIEWKRPRRMIVSLKKLEN